LIEFASSTLSRTSSRKTGFLCLYLFEEKQPLCGISGLVDWRLKGFLSEKIIQESITGNIDETLIFPQTNLLKANHLIVQGIGKRDSLDKTIFINSIKQSFESAIKINNEPITLALPGRPENVCNPSDAIDWFLNYYETLETKPNVTILDTQGAKKIMLSSVERLRLRNSIIPEPN